jgi:hypothetical protein
MYTSPSENIDRPNGGSAADSAAVTALPNEDLQQLLAVVVREFAQRLEGDAALRAFPTNASTDLSATEVLMTVSAMLRSSNIELFELGMWQAWSGSPRSA